jgi:hypothetical protein
MADELKALQARVKHLESQAGVAITLHAYCAAHYNGDVDLYVDCFEPEGAQVHEPGGGEIRGREALGERFRANSHAPESFHKIVLIEPLIELAGGVARAESDWVLVQDGEQGPYISHFGHYSDELVEGTDGRWRFRIRRVVREAIAPGDVAISRR